MIYTYTCKRCGREFKTCSSKPVAYCNACKDTVQCVTCRRAYVPKMATHNFCSIKCRLAFYAKERAIEADKKRRKKEHEKNALKRRKIEYLLLIKERIDVISEALPNMPDSVLRQNSEAKLKETGDTLFWLYKRSKLFLLDEHKKEIDNEE